MERGREEMEREGGMIKVVYDTVMVIPQEKKPSVTWGLSYILLPAQREIRSRGLRIKFPRTALNPKWGDCR